MNNGKLENPQERESFEGQVEVGNEQGQSPHIYICMYTKWRLGDADKIGPKKYHREGENLKQETHDVAKGNSRPYLRSQL